MRGVAPRVGRRGLRRPQVERRNRCERRGGCGAHARSAQGEPGLRVAVQRHVRDDRHVLAVDRAREHSKVSTGLDGDRLSEAEDAARRTEGLPRTAARSQAGEGGEADEESRGRRSHWFWYGWTDYLRTRTGRLQCTTTGHDEHGLASLVTGATRVLLNLAGVDVPARGITPSGAVLMTRHGNVALEISRSQLSPRTSRSGSARRPAAAFHRTEAPRTAPRRWERPAGSPATRRTGGP
jgi:hypothetical protein